MKEITWGTGFVNHSHVKNKHSLRSGKKNQGEGKKQKETKEKEKRKNIEEKKNLCYKATKIS